jgi:hypothetical protein
MHHRPFNTHRPAWVCAAVIATLVLSTGAAACGGDDDDSASEPSLCADADALKSAIGELDDVNVVENGTSELESALQGLRDDANTLMDSARDEFGPDVETLEGALRNLGSAITEVPSDGVQPVQDALRDVEDAASTLADRVDEERCD